MYYVSITEYIRDVTDRIICADGLSNLLLRVNMVAMIFALAVLIQDFKVSYLLLIFAYLIVYPALLILFDLNNQTFCFYLIGFIGALFAILTVLQWQAAIPPEGIAFLDEYCRRQPQDEFCAQRVPAQTNPTK